MSFFKDLFAPILKFNEERRLKEKKVLEEFRRKKHEEYKQLGLEREQIAIEQQEAREKKLAEYKRRVEEALEEGPSWEFCVYLNQPCNKECVCMKKPYYNGENSYFEWRCTYKEKNQYNSVGGVVAVPYYMDYYGCRY